MSGKDDSRRPQRRIDAAAKAEFVAGLRRGESREGAAFAAGFSLMGFYCARSRDRAFKAGWEEALAASAAAERRVRAYATRGERAERGELRIASANRRVYQRRRRRNIRFDARAQAIYLAHFAANCDTKAAAAAAGVHESTVRLHRRNDPAFAEAHDAALAEGYRNLEEETVRLRLAAQKRLRAAIEAAGDPPLHLQGNAQAARPPDGLRAAGGSPHLGMTAEGGGGASCPLCGQSDEGAEFDRIMKLLARRDRRPRRPDSRFTPGGRRQAWTFEEAIMLLDKKLRALGLRTTAPPPEIEGGDRPLSEGDSHPTVPRLSPGQ